MSTRDGYKKKLADKVGYSHQMVSVILNGKANASIEKAKSISRVLKAGGAMVWVDPDKAHKRQEIFDKYKENLG